MRGYEAANNRPPLGTLDGGPRSGLAAIGPWRWSEKGDQDMNPNTRACIAAAVGRLISGSASTSVYDYSRSEHIIINGSISEGIVRLYDNDRQCHFSGSGSNGDYDLYDHGNQAHVKLQIIGGEFRGYDYATKRHFSGTVHGNSVSLYDYGESRRFNYRV